MPRHRKERQNDKYIRVHASHTSTYKYIQVHTSTYKYIQVHTSTYKYIQDSQDHTSHTSTYKYIAAESLRDMLVESLVRGCTSWSKTMATPLIPAVKVRAKALSMGSFPKSLQCSTGCLPGQHSQLDQKIAFFMDLNTVFSPA